MKTISSALQAILAGNQFHVADLYSIFPSGTLPTSAQSSGLQPSFYASNPGLQPIYLTSAERSITANGNLYLAGGVRLERSHISIKLGFEVDDLNIQAYADPNDQSAMVNGAPFIPWVRGGGLDGAAIQLDRAFMPNFGDTSAGTVTLFYGRVSDVQIGRSAVQITVKSMLELLNMRMPRNLYQASCPHTLFDNRCKLSAATFSATATVTDDLNSPHNTVNRFTSTLFQASVNGVAAGQQDGYFALGTIQFLSGENAGIVRAVNDYFASNGTIVLGQPLPFVPANNDTFAAYAGCDKMVSTCTMKFNNLGNFGGFPKVPVPETAR